MRCQLFTLFCVVNFLLPAIARADGAFVVSIHPAIGIWCVLNYNHPDAQSARSAALGQCRSSPAPQNCQVMATFRDSCYAYAFAPNGGYGAGGGPDLASAHASALATCHRYNPMGGCYVRDSGCDTIGAAQEAYRQSQERLRLEEEQRQQQQLEEQQRAAETARREAELEARRAELERQRQLLARQQQEQREQARRSAYSAQSAACREYDAAACEAALVSPLVTAQDRADLESRRVMAVAFSADVNACRSGSLSACTAALDSPALTDARRRDLKEWRAAASPYHRAHFWLTRKIAALRDSAGELITSVRALPTSTHVTGGFAAVLTLALMGIALRSRRAGSHGATEVPESPTAVSVSSPAPDVFRTQQASQAEVLPNTGVSAAFLRADATAATPSIADALGAIPALGPSLLGHKQRLREAGTLNLEDHDNIAASSEEERAAALLELEELVKAFTLRQ